MPIKPKEKLTTITFRMPESEVAKFKALCKEKKFKQIDFVRPAIEKAIKFLDKYEIKK